ncbi:MAG TPA: flagellar hook-basal body complex protein FliE [Gammaproteobacteria bacterium]|nr:flagellar hook-basal body complex protein FliE [Gammaproteobacteria bacterium]
MNEINTDNLLAQMRVMAAQAQGGTAVEKTAAADFGGLLKQSIDQVNEMQQQSRNAKEAFQAGTSDMSLAEVMLTSEKAGIAFQTVLQVRNKVIQAYQDVINMPL